MKKCITWSIIALMIFFSSLAIGEESGFCGDGITWTLAEEGTLMLDGEGETYDYHSQGSPWYSRRDEIKSVIVDEDILALNSYLFEDLINLTDVVLPEGTCGFSSYVFVNCPALKTLHFPDSVNMWGNPIIRNCENVTVYLNSSCSNIIPSLRAGDVEFVVMDSESDFIIKNEVLEAYIGFDREIVIPDGITKIGYEAFGYNESIESVIIPEGVTAVEDYAFQCCSNLKAVQLPDSLKNLGRGVFEQCTSLSSISIPKGMSSISQECFWECVSLKEVSLPSSVTNIAYGAFAKCYNLSDVYYEGTEEKRGRITINNEYECNQELIDAIWHYQEPLIHWSVLPTNTLHIEDKAFISTGVRAVRIQDGCLSIGDEAFAYCSELYDIYIPSSVMSIGKDFLNGSPNATIHCSADSIAFQWAEENNVSFIIE